MRIALATVVGTALLVACGRTPCNSNNVETADHWCVIPLECPAGSQPSLHHERCELIDGGLGDGGLTATEMGGIRRVPTAGVSGGVSGQTGASGQAPSGGAGGQSMTTSAEGDADAGMSAMPTTDTAVPECGNGEREGSEVCDGADCPVTCPKNDNACVVAKVEGAASTCDARCISTEITSCAVGDGCCPKGCNYGSDADCSPSCGDGALSAPETCEPGSADHPCPTLANCNDGDPCTRDTVTGSPEQCSAACSHVPIVAAISGDSCCPAGANIGSDSDCQAACGDGVVSSGEACDTAKPGSCPTDATCAAMGTGCMRARRVGSGCSTHCEQQAITQPADGDECCPLSATVATDSDCPWPSGCSAPSPENTLRNPGLMSSLDDWNVTSGNGAVSWTANDAETCSVSGSAQFSVSNGLSKRLEQCVSVSGAATYYFAAQIKGSGQGETTTCQVDTFNLANCIGNSSTQAQIQWLNVYWGPSSTTYVTTDSAVLSARISCVVDATGLTNAGAMVDSLYFGRADKRF